MDDNMISIHEPVAPVTEPLVNYVNTVPVQELSVVMRLLAEYRKDYVPPIFSDTARERLATLDYVPRAEEEAHLRAPMGTERACLKGDRCIATTLIGPAEPCPLVEHLRPEQVDNPPQDPQLCILCKRYAVTYAYVEHKARNMSDMVMFQSHANYVQQSGEYRLDQCVMAGTTETHGIVAPCAVFCEAYLEYRPLADGTPAWVQTGYGYPSDQDFR